jgi:hypothetical protein
MPLPELARKKAIADNLRKENEGTKEKIYNGEYFGYF